MITEFEMYNKTMELWAEKDIDIYNDIHNDNPILDYTKITWLDRIIYKLKEWGNKNENISNIKRKSSKWKIHVG